MYKEEAEKCGQEFRSFETTNKSLHPPQPFKEYIGLRHMNTQLSLGTIYIFGALTAFMM